MEKSLLEQYKDKFGDPIPLYEIMGNEIFVNKFYGNTDAVYDYCLQHNKTWEEVLGFKFDENVLY